MRRTEQNEVQPGDTDHFIGDCSCSAMYPWTSSNRWVDSWQFTSESSVLWDKQSCYNYSKFDSSIMVMFSWLVGKRELKQFEWACPPKLLTSNFCHLPPVPPWFLRPCESKTLLNHVSWLWGSCMINFVFGFRKDSCIRLYMRSNVTYS